MSELQNPDIGEIERLMLIHSAPIELQDRSTAPAATVGARFMLSEYGIYMSDHQPLRFSQAFGYDRLKMEDDLGTDVLPVHHQWDNGMYVARIIEAEIGNGRPLPIPEDEMGLAVFTAYIHDIGESTHPKVTKAVGETVGDIPYGQKTAHHRAVEAKVRSYFYEELFANVSPLILERAENLITHREASEVHDLLEAAHAIQAFETGMHAGLVANMWRDESHDDEDKEQRSQEEIGQMIGLNQQVSENMAPIMHELVKRYRYAARIATWYGLAA